MGKVYVADHPLIQHKITVLRDVKTDTKEFRALLEEISMMLTYEATRDLPLEERTVITPLTETRGMQISGKKLALIPILRAGLGMVDGATHIVPNARVGHIGLQRDEETLLPYKYYCKLPGDIEERLVLVLDPMLATGGSASAAIENLKEMGCRNLRLLSIIAAPEGIERLRRDHMDVDIYVGMVDDHLNENGYIVPGLGDAGDRLFGTDPHR